MGKSWNDDCCYEKMEMLISINQPQQIDDLIMLEVGDCKFPIRIKERGLSERKSVKSKDVRSYLKEEEVRRNDVGGDVGGEFNAISLERGAIGKDRVGSAAVDVMSKENFFENNIIIEEENLGSRGESNRAREDLINMGLIMQVGPSEDGEHQEVLDQLAEVGEINGLTLKDGNNLTYLEGGGVESERRGMEGEEVRFSIVEDFSLFNQYRRKKKSLNKRIRSMGEVQDSVLSTKEKQRRDRQKRIEKGKAITRVEDQ
ncbi:hypothetical protein GOBAR_AA39499 [Gossypium barbadense]|uniref:Uncharacterized protein n=1 Tax=Gossypium barbadense TaxID=3634 RepID=A0A2P5VQU2_GOSBA|nr:hypothetical protein GOBAR_AA39499 [Gossypium barbadense]